MALANQQAARHNHSYIGTEHVLLGLVKESDGTAGKVLAELGIDWLRAHAEVMRLVPIGPDGVILGKLPQTPATRDVVLQAISEARGMGHNYVGTEHLLLGLMGVDGKGREALVNLGVSIDRVKEMIHDMITMADVAPPAAPEPQPIPTREVWTGSYVSLALDEAIMTRIREAAKIRASETGKATSETDVIREVLEERFGRQ